MKKNDKVLKSDLEKSVVVKELEKEVKELKEKVIVKDKGVSGSKDKLDKVKIKYVYEYLIKGLKDGKDKKELCESLFNEEWNVYRSSNYYLYYINNIEKGVDNSYLRELGGVSGELRKERLEKEIVRMKEELKNMNEKEGDK